MAINKIVAPLSTSPSVFAAPVVNQLLALVMCIGKQEDKIVNGYVKKGSVFNIIGDIFVADSDTAISGTETGSKAVKFTVSANVVTAEYVTSLSDVTYNYVYNGFYDSLGFYYEVDYIYPGALTYPYASAGGSGTSRDVYVPLVNLRIPRSGKWRIYSSFTQAYRGDKYYNTYARIYKNGTPYGQASTVSSVHMVTSGTISEDLYFEKGDICTIYGCGSYHESYLTPPEDYQPAEVQAGIIIKNALIGAWAQ